MEIYTQLPKDLKREIASNVGDPRKFAALLDLDPDLIHVFNQDQLDVIKHMVESGKTVSSWPGVSLLNSSYILIKRLISLGVYFRNGKNNVKLYQANLNSCLRKTLPNPIGAAIQVYSCNSDLMDQNGNFIDVYTDMIITHQKPLANPIDLLTKTKVEAVPGYAVYFPRKLIELLDAEIIFNYIGQTEIPKTFAH